MKIIFTLLNILLITGSAYFGVKSGYQVLTTKLEQAPEPQAKRQETSETENKVQHPLNHYAKISERNLFKTNENPEQKKVEKEEPDEGKELEETKLRLKLWGTVSGASKITYAVIEDLKARRQNLYREGDTVQDATIKRIMREQLILSLNGNDEILKMEEMSTSGRKAAPRPVRKKPEPRASKKKVRTQKVKVARAEIEEAMSDVGSLMKQAKIRPHFKNGKPDGLMITRIRPKSIFRKLGLRSGDVLTGVDGTEIQSVDDALKFYDQLRDASDTTIQVKRRGRLRNIEYNIQE